MVIEEFKRVVVLACVVGLAGCSRVPTLLDPPEDRLEISIGSLGANERAFHKTLQLPHALGLRVPGFIVGLEKIDQDIVTGPKHDETLMVRDVNGTTKGYERLRTDLKAHVITHVTKYEQEHDGIFAGRIVPCVEYSIMQPDGRLPYDPLRTVDPADTMNDGMAKQQFPVCEDWQPFETSTGTPDVPYAGAFMDGWRAVDVFRKKLSRTLKKAPPKKRYSHVLVIVMGWNTPQDNAVENFNSIANHLIDEVQTRTRAGMDEAGLSTFRPLVVGVTWPSHWEINDLIFPPTIIQTLSFPNKANDAKEIGISWLKALMEYAILPARDEVGADAPKIVYIGHSFGARATLTSLTQDQALIVKEPVNPTLKGSFRKGDRYIAFQGAFKVEEILDGEKIGNGLSEGLTAGGMKSVISTSAYDSANELAFWNTYAGMIRAHQKVCGDQHWADVDCAYIPKQGEPGALNYGFGLCDRPEWKKYPVRPRSESDATPFDPEMWRGNGKSVLFLDISELANCRAAFTGGGSHSDIYRRETARLLWDLIK